MKEITQIMSVSDDLRLWTDFQEIITTSGYIGVAVVSRHLSIVIVMQ